MQNLLHKVHPEWHEILLTSLHSMDAAYLSSLRAHPHWLPGDEFLLAAFAQPLSKTRYILLGESPYPRAQSANGYAFWDGAVHELWSATGLSKGVNRATSFRNILKMLLYARGDLREDFSQGAIAVLDKTGLSETTQHLFQTFMRRGILLLNASLVYEQGAVNKHAKQWRPFLHSLLTQLAELSKEVSLILLGRMARLIPPVCPLSLISEHPYNVSFITNPDVVAFFKPLDLLRYEPIFND
ncbi:MAG: uracil-DNA glycosylase [Legionellales bacterium]|nr:uracil-DNA glycosylase [Legionellales bacterium]